MLSMRSLILLAVVSMASAFTAPAALAPKSKLVAASSSFMAPKEVVAASSLSQRVNVFEALKMSCTSSTRGFQMPCRKQCMLLGKRANNAMSVSFSHIRTHKMQQVNLQWKRIFWPEGNCFVKLRISTKAIKTLKTKPLAQLAAKAGLDLNKHKCG